MSVRNLEMGKSKSYANRRLNMDYHPTISAIFDELALQLTQHGICRDVIESCVNDAKAKVLCAHAVAQNIHACEQHSETVVSIKGVPIFLSQEPYDMMSDI